MSEYYFSVRLDETKTLCLAPLTSRNIEASGQEISDPAGYYLYQTSGDHDDPEVEIIAQIVSEEAALQLREMLRME